MVVVDANLLVALVSGELNLRRVRRRLTLSRLYRMTSDFTKTERGRASDIPSLVERVMLSPAEDAYLIINIHQDSAFMQMTGDENGVQLDFPLITPRQRSLEGRIREAATRLGLEAFDVDGSDDARFLDVEVNGEPRVVGAACAEVFREVFGEAADAELIFEHYGLAPGGDA